MYDWVREWVIIAAIDLLHDVTHHAPFYGMAGIFGWACRGCYYKWKARRHAKKGIAS